MLVKVAPGNNRSTWCYNNLFITLVVITARLFLFSNPWQWLKSNYRINARLGPMRRSSIYFELWIPLPPTIAHVRLYYISSLQKMLVSRTSVIVVGSYIEGLYMIFTLTWFGTRLSDRSRPGLMSTNLLIDEKDANGDLWNVRGGYAATHYGRMLSKLINPKIFVTIQFSMIRIWNWPCDYSRVYVTKILFEFTGKKLSEYIKGKLSKCTVILSKARMCFRLIA